MKKRQLEAAIAAIKGIRHEATDEQALKAVYLYPEWNADKEYAEGDRVRYDETLYKCLTAHAAQEMWTPIDASSLWAKVLIPDESEIYEWEQPDSTNPYMRGDRVTYNGKTYESTADNNVWVPGVYGWVEV